MRTNGSLAFLRGLSLIAASAGAVGSVALMRRGGNPPGFLIVIMAAWVVSPFLILIWANLVSKRWVPPAQTTLHVVTIAIAAVTLAIYLNRIMYPPRSTGAFVFVAIPPISCMVIAILGLVRRRARG